MQRVVILFAFVACAVGLISSAVAAPPEKVDLIKVAMIEKVARFIDWPAAPANGQFMLCAAAEHPQLAALRAYYDNAKIAKLPVGVRLLKKDDNLAGCQVAFLIPGAQADLVHLRAMADKEHVLLVGEGEQMARQGVHVGFFADMNKLSVEVNRKSLEAAGLKASFRLLEVVKIVE